MTTTKPVGYHTTIFFMHFLHIWKWHPSKLSRGKDAWSLPHSQPQNLLCFCRLWKQHHQHHKDGCRSPLRMCHCISNKTTMKAFNSRVIQSRPLRKVGQVSGDALHQASKQGFASKSRNWNVARYKPSSESKSDCQGILVEPFVTFGRSKYASRGTTSGRADRAASDGLQSDSGKACS